MSLALCPTSHSPSHLDCSLLAMPSPSCLFLARFFANNALPIFWRRWVASVLSGSQVQPPDEPPDTLTKLRERALKVEPLEVKIEPAEPAQPMPEISTSCGPRQPEVHDSNVVPTEPSPGMPPPLGTKMIWSPEQCCHHPP